MHREALEAGTVGGHQLGPEAGCGRGLEERAGRVDLEDLERGGGEEVEDAVHPGVQGCLLVDG